MSDIEYVSIDRDELKRLQADSEELANLLAAQHQPEPATHSEDGREAELVALEQALDEECGRSGNTVPVGVPLYSITLTEVLAAIRLAGYVEPAQHERILKAKDAEISELDALRDKLSDLLSQSVIAIRGPEPALTRYGFADLPQRVKTVVAERDELRATLDAQPARQVGGDELEQFEAWWGSTEVLKSKRGIAEDAWKARAALAPVVSQVGDEPIRDDDLVLVPRGLLGAARYAIKNKVDAPNVHGQLGEYCYGQAALAPAAVAVDGSASLVNALEQVRTMVGNDEYSDDVIGFINQSIYNHARLNRRAIPVGLLERICKDYTGRENWDALEPDRLAAAAELRALLGKEEE